MTSKDKNYETGYKKPPAKSRFKKGKSGNPKGRPKGSKNTSMIIHEKLEEQITVTENSRRKTMSKREAIITNQVNKAMMGDPKSVALVLALDNISEPTDSKGFSTEADKNLAITIYHRLNPPTGEEHE